MTLPKPRELANGGSLREGEKGTPRGSGWSCSEEGTGEEEKRTVVGRTLTSALARSSFSKEARAVAIGGRAHQREGH